MMAPGLTGGSGMSAPRAKRLFLSSKTPSREAALVGGWAPARMPLPRAGLPALGRLMTEFMQQLMQDLGKMPLAAEKPGKPAYFGVAITLQPRSG